MPLRDRLTGAFDPESMRALSSAFETAWTEFAQRDNAAAHDALAMFAREVLARRILQMGELGERELRVLVDDAIAHLRHAVGRAAEGIRGRRAPERSSQGSVRYRASGEYHSR